MQIQQAEKENNYYKRKNGYTKLPNNSNKVPTRNGNNYPYATTSGTTEQQNKKHPNRNSWKGNFYNNLTQLPTQQKHLIRQCIRLVNI